MDALDRKREIERKKERLQQLRQQRLMRGESLGSLVSIPSYSSLNTSKDVEDLVNQLIGPPGEFKSSISVEEKENVAPLVVVKPIELTVKDVVSFELLPEDRVLYSKEIQTDFVEEKVVQVPVQVVSEIIEPVEQKQEPQKELSEQELFELMISDDFVDFFEKSAKVMERALNEDYDFLKDYNADSQMYFIIIRQEKSKDVIRLYRSFSHERWTKNRNVTDIQWSMRFSELLLGSYNKNTCNINESDGLVLVWNVHLIERPEFVLHSQSDVMAARFSPFNPSIIVGGTFSGQICVWDTRAKPTPVLTTSLSSPGHSHPIYSLSVVGTQNAHNLISASTDGTVCSWQLDMLAQPQDLIELTLANEHNKTDEVAVTCMDFQPQETTTFWIGSEQGTVYQANRFDRAGSKAGIDPAISYGGHQGAITGMSFHPGMNSVEYQSLLLTSSIDWTVKLWKTQGSKLAGQSRITPLKSFEEFDDYVADVSWSPVHPAVFATVDASGTMNIFNINESDVPVGKVSTNKGLNKVDWNSNGDLVAAAGLDGTIDIFDTSMVVKTRSDDSQKFSQILREYQHN